MSKPPPKSIQIGILAGIALFPFVRLVNSRIFHDALLFVGIVSVGLSIYLVIAKKYKRQSG
jgi:hypothetical protein